MLRQTISINYTDLVRGDWWIATHLLSTTVYKNVQITKCPTIPYSNQPQKDTQKVIGGNGSAAFSPPNFFSSSRTKTNNTLFAHSFAAQELRSSAVSSEQDGVNDDEWRVEKKALKEQEVLERIGMLRLLGGITRNLVFMDGIPSRNTTGFGDLFTCSQSGRVGFKRIDLAQASCEWRYVVMIEK